MPKKKVYHYRGIDFIRHDEFEDSRGIIYYPKIKQIKNMLDMIHAIQSSPPPKFNMGSFGEVTDTYGLPESWGIEAGDQLAPQGLRKLGKMDRETIHECGTSACAVGTAAFHGVGRLTKDMGWSEYAFKNFDLRSDMWTYAFDSAWEWVDNTPEGAAARILKFVVEGPEVVMKELCIIFGCVSKDEIGDLSNVLHNFGENHSDKLRGMYSKYLDVKVGAI